ncbi:MAG: tRNA (N6-isopentenyl adenosine(37)-C2)-methylthiotransferase MiaB [Alphaproteobacteria bacterium]|nr:tRNA (N6-isopentenyl adenosine(37)-C2)-methylthiotransferase MiaB [Alphaproteobacteria bacterium]
MAHLANSSRRCRQALSKRLFIKTYGCQMNVYDSRRMADLLAPHGFAPVEGPEGADLVILNTCHIREKAAEKVYSDIGRLRAHQRAKADSGGRMVLAVAGCVAQGEGAEILARAKGVDLVVGPQTYHRLPEALARLARGGGPAVLADFPAEEKFDALPAPAGAQGPAAFLTVQEGCDRFCTFCVVPYTRGPEYSRPVAAILDEARALVAGGARELTLLGQNVNAWSGEGPGGRRWGFARLLFALAEATGVPRLRYTTSHPLAMDAELIAAHRDLPALLPWLHLPVQAGSDRVLGAMNRQHSADEYRRTVAALREARPDIALSSDFIVGFPGESAEDFEATLALVREIGFAEAFAFKYSRRPGTPAAALAGQVREEEKAERLARLQELLAAQRDAFLAPMLGRTVSVLFEKPGRHPGQLSGRSPHFVPVHAEGPASLVGAIREVTVEGVDTRSLAGRLAGKAEAA